VAPFFVASLYERRETWFIGVLQQTLSLYFATLNKLIR
jgi:hypothetical protein